MFVACPPCVLVQVIRARVPLIAFVDAQTGIAVDISVQNHGGVFKSNFTRELCQFDARFVSLYRLVSRTHCLQCRSPCGVTSVKQQADGCCCSLHQLQGACKGRFMHDHLQPADDRLCTACCVQVQAGTATAVQSNRTAVAAVQLQVKLWAEVHGLNDPKSGTLNSWSITQMVRRSAWSHNSSTVHCSSCHQKKAAWQSQC